MRQPPAPTTDAVNRLIQELNRLPGIGPKSAQRLAYYLLRATPEQVRALAESILSVKAETHLCTNCYNITDSDLCLICRNEQRDKSRVLVVEQPQDILAIERTGIYKGLYFVLHGAISPTEGIGPDDLKIKELIERVQGGIIKEVIVATNPTMEGEQTALYLKKLIDPLGVKVTRLARGLPFGSELEYADDVTLTRAIEGRQEL